jgi:NAD(P)-dependent dehydrogenase (short-subunit alcohol dehydrogenase family)
MFNGQVALVTGAANGIGNAIAQALAEQGAEAVIGIDKDQGGLDQLEAQSKVYGIVGDVADAESLTGLIDGVEKKFGGIDILVVAAGLLQPPPLAIESVSERQFDRIIDVNLKGAWNVMRLAGPGMARRKQGSIVTITSITALAPSTLVPYGPAKAALIEMTKSFAAAWGKDGVRVNSVAPGFVETEALKRGAHFGVLDIKSLAKDTALRRLATVQEVVNAACFLASPLASGITGSVIPVDCGALVTPGFATLERHA